MAQQPPRGTVAPIKIKPSGAPVLDEAAIERAEVALQSIAVKFESWIEEEIAHLTEARSALKAEGPTQAAIDALSHRAHDLKGQGATLNFPFVTKIAEQLCRLCEYLPSPDDLPIALVDAHVDAVRAVVRDGIKGDTNPLGLAIVGELNARVQETLAEWRSRASQ